MMGGIYFTRALVFLFIPIRDISDVYLLLVALRLWQREIKMKVPD